MHNKAKIRPWFVWGSAGLFTMYQFLLQGSPSVMIPNLISAFGIDTAQVGFLTTYFFYSYILMQIPSGILIDIFGPKFILILGSASAATACLAFSSCHGLWAAKSSRLVMGLMCAPGIVSTLTLASRWFRPKRFALLVGLTETLAMIGAALGTLALAFSVHHFGWRKATFLCALIGYLVVFLILICVRNHPPKRPKHQITFHPKKEWMNLKTILKEPQAWLGGLYSGLTFSVFPSFFALWSIPFFMDRYQISATMAASIVSTGYLGAGMGGPFIGWLSDHIKRRKIILTLCSFVNLLLLTLIIQFYLPPTWMYLLTFLLGFSVSGYILPYAINGEILPKEIKGKAMGFTNTLTLMIGAPLLQPLIGSLLKSPHDPQKIAYEHFPKALSCLLIATALAFILSFFIQETYCQNKEFS